MSDKIEVSFGKAGFVVTATIKLDGNQWCVGIGENLQEGCHAFASNPNDAVCDFREQFRNQQGG